jgi:hypothetical protein
MSAGAPSGSSTALQINKLEPFADRTAVGIFICSEREPPVKSKLENALEEKHSQHDVPVG